LPASLTRESLDEVCGDIFQAVSETYRGKEWPDVAIFAKCADERGQSAAKDAPVAHVFDTVQINLRRMRNGDALGDEWFFGRRAVELMDAGATEAELDAYRSALFFKCKEVYGIEEAQRMELGFRRRHDDALESAGKARHFHTVREFAA
jgi:hypothetical protein